MAFNKIGSFFLNPGQSSNFAVAIGSVVITEGQDNGTEFFTADPTNDGVPGALQASGFGKQISYNEFFANGRGDTKTAYWLYQVTVKNTGNTGKWFSLQGGGVV